jgi:hypothetical protein
MSDLSRAISLIRKHEGFNEKGISRSDNRRRTVHHRVWYSVLSRWLSLSNSGQCCSKEKALEYLFHEVTVIDTQLLKLNLGLDDQHASGTCLFHPFNWMGILPLQPYH